MMGRLLERHPEWHVAVLVRDEKQKKAVLDRWPQLEMVIGDLDNSALMIKEGSKADVVLRESFETSLKISLSNCIYRNCIRRPYPGHYFSHPGPESEKAKSWLFDPHWWNWNSS